MAKGRAVYVEKYSVKWPVVGRGKRKDPGSRSNAVNLANGAVPPPLTWLLPSHIRDSSAYTDTHSHEYTG